MDTEPAGKVVVFAASSLKDAFEDIAPGLATKGIAEPEYNFGGSQALVAQLSQGAKADVFASADSKSMEAAIEAGTVVSGTQQVLATNRLVVVVPGGQRLGLMSLKDLARPGLKLVLAEKSVPAGNYSLQILDKLSAAPGYGQAFKEQVLANVVSYENNVRQVLAKVQIGEADAGIVYMTDAQSAGVANPNIKVDTIDIPARYNVIARYYIAPVKDAQNADAASRYIAYV
ncbi:MAG TPA: molybdate ABC transporter substrate-binding protein, partial [Chloroflexia bacterium]|nr:molybdate ABC transporter substrate-binding protein [Chloroflexia bacterium]